MTPPSLVALDQAEAGAGVLAAALALAKTTPPAGGDDEFWDAWRLFLGRVADLTERPGQVA